MAENKYDLLLVRTSADNPPRQQPWYKERLRTKMIKSNETTKLDASQWVFLKKGVDDFRDGAPIEGSEGLTERKKEINFPIVLSSASSVAKTTEDRARHRRSKPSKEIAVGSSVLPMKQKRRDNVEFVEKNLLASPLALYPHLEESLESEVFNDVADILGLEEGSSVVYSPSEKSDSIDLADDITSSSHHVLADTSLSGGCAVDRKTAADDGLGSRSSCRLKAEGTKKPSYQWRPGSVEKTGSRTNLKESSTMISSPLETKVETVTKEFCDRMKDLGDESKTIDEHTVKSLFASGYETKPTLSVPIHVVELLNVPSELRQARRGFTSELSREETANNEFYNTRSLLDSDDTDESSAYVPSWADRGSYGAWYLPKSLWKYRKRGETLQDPRRVGEKAVTESKKKMEEMDAVIAPLHGAKAFKEYVRRLDRRMPKAVSNVPDRHDEDSEEVEDGRRPSRPSKS
ncbi:protein FAM47E-like [Oscarella lobularis]|uniref:protein FAM47E-like n=1 Tax=Oscarella lobularis TaxID=121494 RepID=UPI0033136D51